MASYTVVPEPLRLEGGAGAVEALLELPAAVGADGVSLDIESNAATDPTRQAALRESLTLFTERLRAALRRSNPAAVLIFCVTAYPDRPDSNKGKGREQQPRQGIPEGHRIRFRSR